MQAILQEIKELPSVIGTFVYAEKYDAVYPDLPKLLQGKDLKQIGRSLTKVFKLNEKTRMSVNTLEMLYNETMIMAKQIGDDACLVVICDPGANVPLLNMSTSILVNELKEAVKLPPQPARKPGVAPTVRPVAATAASAPKPKAVAPAKTVDVDKLLNEGPLAETFRHYQNALARAIGPIGKMVLKEMVEKWAKGGDCTPARFNELTDMLCEEIGNAGLEKEFRKEMKSFLR